MKKFIKSGAVISALLMAASTSGIGIAGAATTTPPLVSSSNATATFAAGSLDIESAPSFLFNGTNTIATTAQTYTSTSSTSSLGVSNPGTMGGWTVTASASPFEYSTSTPLTGTTLTLTAPTNSGTWTSATGAATADYPTIPASTTLSSTAQTIESAGTATASDPVGVGEFDYQFGATSATIAVPATTVLPLSYSSTITWTLASTSSSSTTPAA